MTQSIDPSPRQKSASDATPSTGVITRFVENLAVVDYVIASCLVLLLAAVALGSGPSHRAWVPMLMLDFALFMIGLAITRGGILKRGSIANEMTYRVTIVLAPFLTYFQLRHILPAVSSRAVDADLLALDLRVFGVEPAVAWDRFVTPQTTEWFAFFYFGYFFILAGHILPMLLNAHDRERLAHFSLGIVFIFCAGFVGYVLVPGWGPYSHLAGTFEHPLEGGLFWAFVRVTVDAGGAQKDIFPSLHTAGPTFFAIFSYMHRRSSPFRYTWPFVAFAAIQIILATMFLRWHYLIDVCAGVALAAVAAFVGKRVVDWEENARRRRGVASAFTIVNVTNR